MTKTKKEILSHAHNEIILESIKTENGNKLAIYESTYMC